MIKSALLLVGISAVTPFTRAQSPPPASPTQGSGSDTTVTDRAYTPPTHGERVRTYARHTFGFGSFFEAGVRAAIDQARFQPSQWQEGAIGYAERYGSAMGRIAVRGTTEYALGELFHEDLRYLPCSSNCSTSKFKAALEDTFEARKGADGHLALSVARLIGPISGELVAGTWLPGGIGRRADTVRGIGLTYGFVFARNLLRELTRR